MGFTEIFGGRTVAPAQTTFLALAPSADVDLEWPVEQAMSGDVVADVIEVNAGAAGLNINIPDARQASTGFSTIINNIGVESVTVRDAAGGTIIAPTSGTAWCLYLADNTTAAGVWRTFQLGASVSVASAAALAGAGLKAIGTTLNQSAQVTSTSVSPVAVDDADRAKLINWTGGVGVADLPTPASVGNDWFFQLRNSGSGDVTVTPAAGTIDGAASKVFAPGASAFIITDGNDYFTVGYGGGASGGGSFDFVEINVAGSGDYVLSGVNLGRIAYRFTGLLTGNRNIVVPGSIAEYWVANDTTGAFSLFVKTAAQVTPVEVLQTQRAILYCDSNDVIDAESSSVSFPIPVSQGGTGATSASAARTNLGAGATGSTLFTAATTSAARTTLGATATGDALFTAASATAARTTLGAGATGGALFTAATAAAARTTLGATATGDALFTAASATAARTTLGATATGDALFTAASASAARTTLGAGATGGALFTAATAAAARTTLGSGAIGDSLFTAATASAARTTLGATATGDALFTAASASAARTTLGATSTGGALFTAASASAARTTLGSGAVGDALFTASTTTEAQGDIGLPHILGNPFTVTHNTATVASTPHNIDLSTASNFLRTLSIASTTITFSNPPASNRAFTFTIFLRQDATGSRTVTWPASVHWSDGLTPVLTTTANRYDAVTLTTFDGGVTYYGGQVLANMT